MGWGDRQKMIYRCRSCEEIYKTSTLLDNYYISNKNKRTRRRRRRRRRGKPVTQRWGTEAMGYEMMVWVSEGSEDLGGVGRWVEREALKHAWLGEWGSGHDTGRDRGLPNADLRWWCDSPRLIGTVLFSGDDPCPFHLSLRPRLTPAPFLFYPLCFGFGQSTLLWVLHIPITFFVLFLHCSLSVIRRNDLSISSVSSN